MGSQEKAYHADSLHSTPLTRASQAGGLWGDPGAACRTLELFPECVPPPAPGGESDEWYTPAALFEPLNAEFRFTVDVCATAESAKVPRFYSLADNGLKQSWRGERVWCNPPYSDIRPWVAKATAEVLVRECELVAMLLPSRTDRQWWHEFIESKRDRPRLLYRIETRFVKGRVPFGYPGNPLAHGSDTGREPSVVVVWRAVLG